MEKILTFENFALEKGIQKNWNPNDFFIGEDIVSISTETHELQVFTYRYNGNEIPEYFEMNFGKKEPLDNEDHYEFDIIESSEFLPLENNLKSYLEIAKYLCTAFVDNFDSTFLCIEYIKYIPYDNTDSLCLLFVTEQDFKQCSEKGIPLKKYNSDLVWELINTLEKNDRQYYTAEIIRDYI